jgi:capsular exopolysaccharide synthesis family protein
VPPAPPEPSTAASPARDEIDLGRVLSTLWRGKLWVLACLLLSLALGAAYAYGLAVPLYRASAVVVLEAREAQVVDLESVISGLGSDSMAVNTEVEVLQSRSLLGKVVDRLALTADPEFNHALRPATALDRIGLWLGELLGQPAPPAPGTAAAREATIDALIAAQSVRNVAQSLVFQITVTSEGAEKSARIADAIVESYILDQLEVKFEATEQATKWLTGRLSELQVELEEAEGRVKAFRAETDLISPEMLAAMEVQFKDQRERLAEIRSARAADAERLAALRAAQTPAAQAEVTGDAQLARLLTRLPQATARAGFETRVAQIAAGLETAGARAATQIAALERSRDALAAQIERQSADLIVLQQLSREAEASRLLYEYFLNRLKETSAQRGIQQADSRLLSAAVVPARPALPRRGLVLVLAALAGFVAGAALVLLREAMTDSFRDARELERATGLPVLGQLIQIPGRRRRETLQYLQDKPASGPAEAIRNLRTSLLLSNVDAPPQVTMVCSSLPGEGKTTVAMALAQNLSHLGKRVLLIEGDIRRRVFRQYMDVTGEEGLVQHVAGAVDLEAVLIHDALIGTDVLMAGESTANAADIFSSERFAAVMADLRGRYDQIIIDTPPVLVVPDARIIARHVDALAFVVHWDRTARGQVGDALREFEMAGGRVTGLVLNQINPRRMKAYGYGGKYGAYASYRAKYYLN